uniref:Secreted protein n=1 Tax=Parascaris univalens TaxID=6257 RepID=A0A915AU90_PARUN
MTRTGQKLARTVNGQNLYLLNYIHFATCMFHMWLRRASINEMVLFVQFLSSSFRSLLICFWALFYTNIIVADLDSKRFKCVHRSLYGSLWSSEYDSGTFVIEDTS